MAGGRRTRNGFGEENMPGFTSRSRNQRGRVIVPIVENECVSSGQSENSDVDDIVPNEDVEMEDEEGDDGAFTSSSSNKKDIPLLARKLVRLALASEFSRTPLRRADMGIKVLANHSRLYKPVFAETQNLLRRYFGMELVELPLKDKITVQQRRVPQNWQKASLSSKFWILSSVLPSELRDASIIPPPRNPTEAIEASYIGLYTFILSLIYLNGGALTSTKLERYLRRARADTHTPVDKTDQLLLRLQREGYLVRTRDQAAGEDAILFTAGPRGKIEIGPDGIKKLIKFIYGSPDSSELDKKIDRSLGIPAPPVT